MKIINQNNFEFWYRTELKSIKMKEMIITSLRIKLENYKDKCFNYKAMIIKNENEILDMDISNYFGQCILRIEDEIMNDGDRLFIKIVGDNRISIKDIKFVIRMEYY